MYDITKIAWCFCETSRQRRVAMADAANVMNQLLRSVVLATLMEI
jgi:hypothetical protein